MLILFQIQLQPPLHNHKISIVKTRKMKNFVTKMKIDAARKKFGRNVGKHAISAKMRSLYAKTRKRELFVKKTKTNVTRRVLKRSVRRLVVLAN